MVLSLSVSILDYKMDRKNKALTVLGVIVALTAGAIAVIFAGILFAMPLDLVKVILMAFWIVVLAIAWGPEWCVHVCFGHLTDNFC